MKDLFATAFGGNVATVKQVRDKVLADSAAVLSTLGITVKRKTADESVTSSVVLQDDDDLVFAIAASEEWVADFHIIIDGDLSAHGLKADITIPSGATQASIIELVGNVLGESRAVTTAGTATFTAASITSSTDGALHVHVRVLNSTTGGNVQLQFAQETSSATALTFKEGSHLVAHRIN